MIEQERLKLGKYLHISKCYLRIKDATTNEPAYDIANVLWDENAEDVNDDDITVIKMENGGSTYTCYKDADFDKYLEDIDDGITSGRFVIERMPLKL